jgi:HK97 family phage major capsid protein
MATATETKDRVKELQTALRERVETTRELSESFEITEVDGEKVVNVSAEQKAEFDKVMGEVRDIKGLIESLQTLDEVEAWGSEPKGSAAAAAAAAGDSRTPRSIGRLFAESEEFKALDGGRNGYTMASPYQLQMADIGGRYKDVYSDLPTGTPGNFGPVVRDPIVPRSHRTVRVRDLFPVQATTAAVIEYFRVTGFTNQASPVPERDGSDFAAKNQSTLTFVGAQAPVRTIAHWEAAHRNVLADVPQLEGIINNELLYGLRLEEDRQILSGTGTGEDLTGILTDTGVQQYLWSDGTTGDEKSDAIRRAATLAFLAYYEPTGVVLHPNDWEDIELQKDDNGAYLVAISVALGAEPRLWRLPVVDTPAIPEGTALVGAFGIGAQLYDREQANIRVAEQHSDFFVRNAVVILAEERLALAIKRPEAFVEVTFDNAPS